MPFRIFEFIKPDASRATETPSCREKKLIQKVTELKTLLLEILESAFPENGDVYATQQMGVNVSNAVKREGVVIRNQNVEVLARIICRRW